MISLDINVLLLSIVFPIVYAVSGAWEAQQAGEKIDWVIFSKTIFTGFIAAGLLQQATADALILIVGTAVITKILDKAINALLNKVQRTNG